MKKILVVVDMQNDFITGSLGSEYAKNVVLPNVEKKLIQHGDYVIFTMDTHFDKPNAYIPSYNESLEGHKLPVKHCVVGTEGYEIAQSLKNWYASVGWKHKSIVHKYTFGSFDELPKIVKKYLEVHSNRGEKAVYDNIEDAEIEIVGLCTDICVVSNALILRAAFPNVRIVCDASCCGGTSKEAHDAALAVMRSCQIDVIGD